MDSMDLLSQIRRWLMARYPIGHPWQPQARELMERLSDEVTSDEAEFGPETYNWDDWHTYLLAITPRPDLHP